MKKLHLAFGIAALAGIIVGLIHGGVAWIVAEATWEPATTSFPTWAAFVLPILFYSVGVLAILLAWFVAWRVARRVASKRLQKRDQRDILSS